LPAEGKLRITATAALWGRKFEEKFQPEIPLGSYQFRAAKICDITQDVVLSRAMHPRSVMLIECHVERSEASQGSVPHSAA
jgi:hypothetical protein